MTAGRICPENAHNRKWHFLELGWCWFCVKYFSIVFIVFIYYVSGALPTK